MPGSLNNALLFLITTLFNIYLFVLCARFILAWSRADYFNPITRTIIQMTQPIIAPLRYIIPNYGRMETSTLFFIVVLEIIKIYLLSWIIIGSVPFIAVFFTALENTLKLFLSTFFYAIIAFVIMSWVSPGPSPLRQVLSQLSTPVLRPCQRLIPPMGGLDLSPFFAVVILQFLMILL
jgi:YggT family protein